jgi:hypothetical protein
LLSVATIAMLSVALVGCGGDENDDPKPQKTNLELVKEGIVGEWQFVSAEITKDGTTMTYTGGCNFTGKPTWYQANAIDSDYIFRENLTGDGIRNCSSQEFDMTYNVIEQGGKFIVEISDGGKFEVITAPEDISGNTVKVKVAPLLQGVSSNILTFTKSN